MANKECNHVWREIEDYNSVYGFLFKEKVRVKIFECNKCGSQHQRMFALQKDEVVEK